MNLIGVWLIQHRKNLAETRFFFKLEIGGKMLSFIYDCTEIRLGPAQFLTFHSPLYYLIQQQNPFQLLTHGDGKLREITREILIEQRLPKNK